MVTGFLSVPHLHHVLPLAILFIYLPFPMWKTPGPSVLGHSCSIQPSREKTFVCSACHVHPLGDLPPLAQLFEVIVSGWGQMAPRDRCLPSAQLVSGHSQGSIVSQSPDHLGLPRGPLSSILDLMMGLHGWNMALLSSMDSYKKFLTLSHASSILGTGPLGV